MSSEKKYLNSDFENFFEKSRILILDKRNFESIPYHWNSWGLKSGGEVFSTAKGKKKYGHRYKNLKYTWFTDKEKLRYHKERNKNYGKS